MCGSYNLWVLNNVVDWEPQFSLLWLPSLHSCWVCLSQCAPSQWVTMTVTLRQTCCWETLDLFCRWPWLADLPTTLLNFPWTVRQSRTYPYTSTWGPLGLSQPFFDLFPCFPNKIVTDLTASWLLLLRGPRLIHC